MSRKSLTILSDAARGLAPVNGGDWHDVPRHHRYYGSSACNGGERIIERRSGLAARTAKLIGL